MGVRQSHFTFNSLSVRFAFNRITRRCCSTARRTNAVIRWKAKPYKGHSGKAGVVTGLKATVGETVASGTVLAEIKDAEG